MIIEKIMSHVFHKENMDFAEIKRVVSAYANRNNIILTDVNDKAIKGEINLHWWKQKMGGKTII